MSRIETVNQVRNFLMSPISTATLVVAFLLCGTIFVSFADIIRNIMLQAEWGGRFSYTYSSFLHTRMVVQVLAVLTSISCLLLLAKIMLRLRTPIYGIGSFIASRSPLKFLRS